MQGTRHDYGKHDGIPLAGEYGKLSDGSWYGIPPEHPELLAGLRNHQVIEHEDGTITVSPSILVWYEGADYREQWHGYLERGIWREV